MHSVPPPPGHAPSVPPLWTPPTEVERALVDAKNRSDWTAYYETLALTWLYFVAPRQWVDAAPDKTHWSFGRDPLTSALRWEIFTDGMLPAPEPDRVYTSARLPWIARQWTPERPQVVVINPGSPAELALPFGPPGSTEWSQVAARVGEPPLGKRLRGLSIGGVLSGPVAHGLALGALLCVNNGSLWNAMGWHGTGYPSERSRLREWWGIRSREDWQHQTRTLLACEASSSTWTFVLSVRRSIARNFGGHVDVGYWRQTVAQVLRSGVEGRTVLGPDGVTRTEPIPEAESEALIEGTQRLIGRITRYEARMRADGVLDENRYVTSVDAWDLGRASKMARWGVGARYATVQEAEAVVVEAGRSASLSYRSWQDFSAGYILGRSLHFDEEEFGEWYESMISAHRILMSDPGSPWLNLPFR